jgi:hypothetical protein
MTHDIDDIRNAFHGSPCTHAVAIVDSCDTMLGAPWLVIVWQIGQFEESGRIGEVKFDHELSEILAMPLMNFSPAIFDVRVFGNDEMRKVVARQAIEFTMSSLCGTGGEHDA